MVMAMIVVLTVVLGSLAMANRATGGNLASAFQGQSREAREVAEAGLTAVISELNKPANRQMLVAPVAINSWNTSNLELRNPCQNANSASPVTPTGTAVGFRNGAINNIDSSRSFIVTNVTIKNGDRSKAFTSGSLANQSGVNSGYDTGLINLARGRMWAILPLLSKGLTKAPLQR